MDPTVAFTVNRKIASGVAPLLARTPLTPNQVTSLSLAAGLGAAYFMSAGSRAGMLAGAFFLQLSFIFDDCDGALARAKSLQSAFGMWYDFAADLLVDFALWAGLAVGALRQGVLPPGILLAAALAACAGSLIHFFRVTAGRLKGRSGKEPPPESLGPFLSSVHVLSRDGDPSALVWLAALWGNAAHFLVLGCVYVHSLWILETVLE